MPAQNMTVYLSGDGRLKPSNLRILGLKDCHVLYVNTVTTSLHSRTASVCLFATAAGTCIILMFVAVDCLMKIRRDFCPGVI